MDIPRPTASAIDYSKLPPVTGSVLAHRMLPQPVAPTLRPGLGCATCAAIGVAASVWFGWDLVWTFVLVSASSLLAGWLIGWAARRRIPPRPPLSVIYRTWDGLITALQGSPFAVRWEGKVIRERDHVFLGTLQDGGAPVLIHEQSLMHHALICGPPASGKTYRIIVPASTQLMRRKDRSFVVIDLKGSKDLFQTFRIRSHQLELPFKYFTLENGRASHLFNPLIMPGFRALTLNQRTQCLLEGLALAYAEGGYGRQHFGGVNEEVMRAVLQAHPEVSSFREIVRILKAPGARRELGLSERTFEQASGLQAILDRMSETEQLQAAPGDGYDPAVFREAIDLREVMERPSVLYFHLPTNLERTSARLVGRIVATLLVAIARREGRSPTPIVVVIDEFLQIIDGSFEPILQQARDLGISFWLALQYLAGLRTQERDYSDLVLNSCHFKAIFAATDMAGRHFLETAGGLVKHRQVSQSTTETTSQHPSTSTSVHATDHIDRRITQEHINFVNRHENLGFLSVDPGYGYCQFRHPVVARFGFSQSVDQFRRLSALPWPSPAPGTIPSSRPRMVTPASSAADGPPPTAPGPDASPSSPASAGPGRYRQRRREARDAESRPPATAPGSRDHTPPRAAEQEPALVEELRRIQEVLRERAE